MSVYCFQNPNVDFQQVFTVKIFITPCKKPVTAKTVCFWNNLKFIYFSNIASVLYLFILLQNNVI